MREDQCVGIVTGKQPVCVFSSEIKPYAIQVYKDNYKNEHVAGDITQIKSSEILILS